MQNFKEQIYLSILLEKMLPMKQLSNKMQRSSDLSVSG